MDLMDFRNPRHVAWFAAFGGAVYVVLTLAIAASHLNPPAKALSVAAISPLFLGAATMFTLTRSAKGRQRILERGQVIEDARQRFRFFGR